MSKLPVVICAATFFTLAMAATLKTVDSSEFHLAIDTAIGTIRQCADGVHQKMLDLGPQPLDIHPDIREEYETNITDTMKNVHATVRDILKTVQLESDKKKCSKYFEKFAATGNELVENSLTAVAMDFMNMIGSVREVSILSSQKQEELNKAKLNPCARSSCNTFGNDVSMEALVSQFCSDAKELTEAYVALVNGTRTRHMLFSSADYVAFLSKRTDVVNKTYSCVSSIGTSDEKEIAVSVLGQ